MPQKHVPGANGPPVTVGAPRPADTAPTDVCPSVVEPRADDSRRYIVYSDETRCGRVADCWLSVDLDVVVARESWR